MNRFWSFSNLEFDLTLGRKQAEGRTQLGSLPAKKNLAHSVLNLVIFRTAVLDRALESFWKDRLQLTLNLFNFSSLHHYPGWFSKSYCHISPLWIFWISRNLAALQQGVSFSSLGTLETGHHPLWLSLRWSPNQIQGPRPRPHRGLWGASPWMPQSRPLAFAKSSCQSWVSPRSSWGSKRNSCCFYSASCASAPQRIRQGWGLCPLESAECLALAYRYCQSARTA